MIIRFAKSNVSRLKLLRVAGSLIAALSTAPVGAQWALTDLGDLPGGGPQSAAYAINNRSQVVGWSSGNGLIAGVVPGPKAFLWQNGSMINLGTPPGTSFSYARGINDSGQVVGYSPSPERAIIRQGSSFTYLGDLPGGLDLSEANDINNSGQVVGLGYGPDGPRGVLWHNGTITDLGDFPGGTRSSEARAINNLGQIVGTSGALVGSASVSVPFIWENGTMVSLGALPGGNGGGIAFDINDAGQVVGGAAGSASSYSAFIWQNGVMTGLGDLPGGSSRTEAYGINSLGQVVGMSGSSGGRAVLWQNGVAIDLNTVSGVAGSGWRLTEARAINDAGQIVGSGLNPDGSARGFILTPIPEPGHWAMLLFGLGLVGHLARRKVA